MQLTVWAVAFATFIAQVVLAARACFRMLRTAKGLKIAACHDVKPSCVTVIVPVLNEERRIGGCLESLRSQGPALREVIVVDGGSGDATCEIVRIAAASDTRLRLVLAPAPPAGWNGKAWNLEIGLREADAASRFVATIDADVRGDRALVSSLVAHARTTRLAAFSVATRQRVDDVFGGALHPSMLTTLVYRFGIPGSATASPQWVQANGQCFFAERELLVREGAIAKARSSRCEDVTMARALASSGVPFGFFEAGDLAQTTMYENWRDLTRNWPRSLAMLDQYSGVRGWIGLLQIVMVQAVPLWLLAALLIARSGMPLVEGLLQLQFVLVAMRFGILCGTRRAYATVSPTYWLSPLFDAATVAMIVSGAVRRRHTWRGRTLVREAAL
jgi:dolichol-phosphate mannosyltransferase